MMNPPLLANVLAPYVAWGVGDDVGLSLPYSMLATILAAFIERPFTNAAGFGRLSLHYSMRANILSWMFGLVIAYASLACRAESLFFAMYFLAIPFSIAIEGGYLSLVKKRAGSQLAWKPIVFGNLLSGLVLVVVLVIGLAMGVWCRSVYGFATYRVLSLPPLRIQKTGFSIPNRIK